MRSSFLLLLLSLSLLLASCPESAAVKTTVRKRHETNGESSLHKPPGRKAWSVLEEQALDLPIRPDQRQSRSSRRPHGVHLARLQADILKRLAEEQQARLAEEPQETASEEQEDQIVKDNGKVVLIHTTDGWLVGVERMHVWRTGDWRTSKCYFSMPFHPDNVVLAKRIMGHVSQHDDDQNIRRHLERKLHHKKPPGATTNKLMKRYLEPFYIVIIARYLQTIILRILLRALCVMSTSWACDARGGSYNMNMVELAFYLLITVLAPRLSNTFVPAHYLVLAMYAVNAEDYLAWFSGKKEIPSAAALKGIDYLPLLCLQWITTSYLDAFVAKHFSPDRRPIHRRFVQSMLTTGQRIRYSLPP